MTSRGASKLPGVCDKPHLGRVMAVSIEGLAVRCDIKNASTVSCRLCRNFLQQSHARGALPKARIPSAGCESCAPLYHLQERRNLTN